MKKMYGRLVLGAMALGSGSLMYGYAIVHASASAIPAVDIYTYEASSATDAMNKHKSFASKLGVPGDVINIMDKVKGYSAPVAGALKDVTKGKSVMIQKGYEIGVEVLKKANELLGPQIKDLIGRASRGSHDAYHDNVPRGNRGRMAEWSNGKVMYAIVTLPGSVIPINETPEYIRAGGVNQFSIVGTPQNDGTMLYTVVWVPLNQKTEYIRAESDKRNFYQIRELAKQSGAKAAEMPPR